MAKRLNIGKWFQLSLMGVCLVMSLLSTSGIGADCLTSKSSPKIRTDLETPKPIYLSPEQMKKMDSPVLTSRAPMIPLKLDPSSFPKLNPLTDLPVWMEICMSSQPLRLLTMTSIPGKAIFVYDDLNRLIRAIYNQTTVSYTYDEAGNRLSRTVILSKPMGTVDFDADAENDIAIYRVSTGQWFIIPSSTGVPYGVGWGLPDDKPVPGDYDGDGKTDIALYRASDGGWRIMPSGGGEPYAVGWGGSGFQPVPGDYDGDGKIDIAVYETATGAWYIIPSSTGVPYGLNWGGDPTDIPLPGILPSTY